MTPVTFAALAANGSTAETVLNVGQKIGFFAEGTWGGGSLQLQMSADGTNWVSLGSPLTANGGAAIDAPPCRLRATLTGATTPSINVSITRS